MRKDKDIQLLKIFQTMVYTRHVWKTLGSTKYYKITKLLKNAFLKRFYTRY